MRSKRWSTAITTRRRSGANSATVAAGRTEEALTLQARAAERFEGVGDDPVTSPEIWQLVDW